MTIRTIRNDKSGAVITTSLTDEQAMQQFVANYAGSDNWLWFWVHKAVQEVKVRDADAASDYIADWFLLAVGHGLKKPMIRVHYRNRRFKLYLSERGTICLKTGALEAGVDYSEKDSDDTPTSQDPVGDEEYAGCFLNGRFVPAKDRYTNRERALSLVEVEFLGRLKADPVKFLADCGKDMNRCCYCALPLEDARSKAVGYGPICAKRWSLPWGDSKASNKVVAFNEVYNDECHRLCVAVRRNVEDQVGWDMLNDWFQERSVLKVTRPSGRVRYPRYDGPAPKAPTQAAPEVVKATPETPKTISVPSAAPPAIQPAVRLDSDRFTYRQSTLTATASDLGWTAGNWPPYIEVRSAKTGDVLRFNPIEPEMDKQGELMAVRYRSDTGLLVRVFND